MYREIINDHLFPFVAQTHEYKAKLHQDNESKHSSAICTEALKNFNIKWIKSPPKSHRMGMVRLKKICQKKTLQL
jgi:hypothetical protein